jgi:aminomethyltransferase
MDHGSFDPQLTMPLETPLLEMHRAAGAELAETFGTLLPARFADFAKEYAAASSSVALVDTNYRAVFSFTGPDGQRYLNAILTSNVRDLKPGGGVVGLLLTPQGHILAEVETLLRDSGLLAWSHAMVRERTFSTFEKFIIMDDVTLEDATPATGTLDLLGPMAASVISELAGIDLATVPVLSHVEATLASIPCRVVRKTWTDHPAAMIAAPVAQLPALWRELESQVRARGGAPAGMQAINSIRLEWGAPWFGHDFGDKNIPHEAGLEHSHISYEKGCYTGQEIVERVRSRGHANRRLTELQFPAASAPAAGAALLHDGKEIGEVTSVAFSPVLGRPIGLGYVRREHAAPGTALDASGTPAEVIPPPLPAKRSAA